MIEIASQWYCSRCEYPLAYRDEECPLCRKDDVIMRLHDEIDRLKELLRGIALYADDEAVYSIDAAEDYVRVPLRTLRRVAKAVKKENDDERFDRGAGEVVRDQGNFEEKS